jgi:flagellin
MVVPGKTLDEFRARCVGGMESIVLANRPSLQAVRNASLGLTGIAFYEHTTENSLVIHDNVAVTVNDNALVFQVGANSNQTVEIAINSLESTTLGTGVTDNMFNNLSEISVLTSAQAQDAIEVIDEAIQEVSQRRGDLGGFQKNTLESNAKNLAVAEENLVATESIIRDTDFASEMARLTKNQILLQSGTAMLTQANQMPQVVLQLLS